jgi:T5SS/PEP-CTERM-associated repeat protein
MMSKKLIYLALVGMLMGLAGNLRAVLVYWDDGAADPNDHLWSTPANWVGDALPTSADEAYIDKTPALPRTVLDATIFSGYPGGALVSKVNVGRAAYGELLITGGAKLTATSDLNIGYSGGATGIVTVDGRNTLVSIGGGTKVGRSGYGRLEIRGGTVQSIGNIDIPSSASVAGSGHLQLSGGTLTGPQLRMRENVLSIGTMDVCAGTLILTGDRTTAVGGFITSGWITAYGGYGTLQMDYNVRNLGKTTLTALSKLNPSPADGAVASNLTGTVPLSWTNLDPNHPGAPVTVDVWFGSDPNKTANTKLLTGSPLSTVNATGIPVVPFGGPYYWWVDTHNGGPKVITAAFSFYVTNDTVPSVVMNTPSMQTWINQPVPLNITVTDDGLSPVTFLWASSDPNAVFSPSNTVEDPTVKTNWSSGTFTATVTVRDGNPLGATATASVSINCASSACAAARRSQMGIVILYPTDIVPDCVHNLQDLAALAQKWLINYALTIPTPLP